MTTTKPGDSAAVRVGRRGARARDFTMLEAKMVALYHGVLDELAIDADATLLDVGCGPGLFLRLATQRGATVTGIDAAGSFVEIARERVPGADVNVGEMHALPYDDDTYNAVTGFNSFQFAADPTRALREAGRVARRGAPVVIATWGRPEEFEAAGYVRALGALLPQPPPGMPDPFTLSEIGALEDFARQGGLEPGERREALCVWEFADEDELLRALKSTGFAVRAIETVGEENVSEAVLEGVAPYRTSDGGCRLENVFAYIVASG